MTTYQLVSLVFAVPLLTLTACSTAAPLPPKSSAAGATTCALGVADARVALAETRDGIDLTFIAPTRVNEIRVRSNDAAAMYGPGARRGGGHDDRPHGEGGRHGLMAMQLPPVRITVEEVPEGATLHLVASDAADIERLQTRARERAGEMNKACH